MDNASVDGSVEMVRREFPHVRLIVNTKNRGFAAANNQGIAVAKGRYILLLNSDTIVLDGAIARTVAFADAHDEAGIVGCRVLNADRTLQPTCFMFPSVLNMLLSSTYLYKLRRHSRFFGRERMTWWRRDDIRDVEVVTGCCMLARRDAVDQVGGMDDAFFMYGEETDWCFRVRSAGWRIMFFPYGEIIHFGGASTRQEAAEMLLQLKAGILQFVCKHRRRSVYVMCCVLMGLFFALRLPFWAINGVICPRNRRRSWSYVVTYTRGLWRVLRGWRGLRGAAIPGRTRHSEKSVRSTQAKGL